jgi:cytochrome c-type protein NapC
MNGGRMEFPRRSAGFSVPALLIVGFLVGAGAIIAGAVAVEATGTNEFCSTACHERGGMATPAKEWKQSVHYANPKGVQAGCHDCHIPHTYPDLLIVKAKSGITDAYSTMMGTISTPEKYEANRWRMANEVWEEMRKTDSVTCRHCHNFTPEVLAVQAKDNEMAAQMHKSRKEQKMTCIDCHQGVAHKVPDDPAAKKSEAKPAPQKAAETGSPEQTSGSGGDKPAQVAAAGGGTDGGAIAEKAGCGTCHAKDEMKMAPSWKDVAAKHKPEEAGALAAKLSKGEGHPEVKIDEAGVKAILAWAAGS